MARVTYVPTRPANQAILRATAVVWVLFALIVVFALTNQSDAVETCQRHASADTCSYVLR